MTQVFGFLYRGIGIGVRIFPRKEAKASSSFSSHLSAGTCGVIPCINAALLQAPHPTPPLTFAGSKLRTNLMEDGGVAPVASTRARALEAAAELGGAEESFAFSRAVSRLHEMQSPLYLAICAISRKWAA